jgi:thiol peroxidase
MSKQPTVTMHGTPLRLTGPVAEVGQRAPDFTAVNSDLQPVRFADIRGRTCVIASVPSLDTSVCSLETRTFNERAAAVGEGVTILAISMDLPFAQKRWCGAEGVERVVTLSDHRDASFGRAYGVLIEDLRLLARAVFVVDADGVIRYRQLVAEIAAEPDYDAALRAVAECEGAA